VKVVFEFEGTAAELRLLMATCPDIAGIEVKPECSEESCSEESCSEESGCRPDSLAFTPSGLDAPPTSEPAELPPDETPAGVFSPDDLLTAQKLRAIPFTPERLDKAWSFCKDTVRQWVKGFEVEGAKQPDRLRLMTDMGHGAWPAPILKLAYEKYGSLQQMVQMALRELREEGEELFGDDKAEEFADDQKAWLEYVDRVAATMV